MKLSHIEHGLKFIRAQLDIVYVIYGGFHVPGIKVKLFNIPGGWLSFKYSLSDPSHDKFDDTLA